MKLSGVQYYWIVMAGLVAGPVIGITYSLGGRALSNEDWKVAVFLFLSLFPAMCYYVSVADMWSKFGWKFPVGVFFIVFAGVSVFPPAILVLYVGPLVYWVSKINGSKQESELHNK